MQTYISPYRGGIKNCLLNQRLHAVEIPLRGEPMAAPAAGIARRLQGRPAPSPVQSRPKDGSAPADAPSD